MKKLLCVTLFSMVIMANANFKEEITPNNFGEFKIEKN